MIKVLVSGALGKMGTEVESAVRGAGDLQLVGLVDPKFDGPPATSTSDDVPRFNDLAQAIEATSPDVAVDFTAPAVAEENVKTILAHGVDCVLGTTGLSIEQLTELAYDSGTDAALFFAPNFTIGAVLMMRFAREAAPYLASAEIIEMHHENKKDAPSGTALETARLVDEARKDAGVRPTPVPGKETELDGMQGARGGIGQDGVPIHSVRMPGFTASQEVIFGSSGQTLSIRHDSNDRAAYMPGVLMAIRAIGDLSGLTIGLEKLMKD